MKIYIITMEDPVYTLDFFMKILNRRHKDIIGIAISEGNRLKIGKNRSKAAYIFSLLLIMGPYHFLKNAFITLNYKFCKKLNQYINFIDDNSLSGVANRFKIPIIHIDSPNNQPFLEYLKNLNPDVIINQSQHIIKKQLLEIPNYCVLNRHNALLPKNRGRLTPFWAIYNGDKETGVTIHIVNEGIDSGPIVVQWKFKIEKRDTFNTIARKNYEIASAAMLEALIRLEEPGFQPLLNDSKLATYNTVPSISNAFQYRWLIIKRFFD